MPTVYRFTGLHRLVRFTNVNLNTEAATLFQYIQIFFILLSLCVTLRSIPVDTSNPTVVFGTGQTKVNITFSSGGPKLKLNSALQAKTSSLCFVIFHDTEFPSCRNSLTPCANILTCKDLLFFVISVANEESFSFRFLVGQ